MLKNNRLHGLYAITDSQQIPVEAFSLSIQQVLQGGARIIQYRDKSSDTEKRLSQACELRELCNQFNALFIINDDVDLALNSNADGIHLGKDDISISEARALLGNKSIIGQSCYNDINLSIKAEQSGANYVAFGAVYSSPTKPKAPIVSLETIQQASTQLLIPICAIGGITVDNAKPVINAGSDMVAVISGLFAQPSIEQASRNLSSLF